MLKQEPSGPWRVWGCGDISSFVIPPLIRDRNVLMKMTHLLQKFTSCFLLAKKEMIRYLAQNAECHHVQSHTYTHLHTHTQLPAKQTPDQRFSLQESGGRLVRNPLPSVYFLWVLLKRSPSCSRMWNSSSPFIKPRISENWSHMGPFVSFQKSREEN